PWLSQALVYGAPTLLAGWLLLTIWRPTKDPENEETPADPGAARPC
ncbi:signal peptidase, endoplasmic reticulum-type, partial [Geodermatophilus ruber]